MSWIVEQPLPILFIGVFLFAVAAAVWSQLRSRGSALAMLLVALTTLALIGLESVVVTEREQVEATLHQIADDLQRNDLAAVLGHISTEAPDLRSEVERALARVTVEKISIKSNLQVELVPRASGLGAEARFNAVATLQDRSGLAGTHVVPRFVIAQLRQEQGQWKVRRYEAQDPREGL